MQARAGRTRRIILKAAADIFEARGYMGTSLQEVVALQDVSKGALYFHFPSKEQLAAAVIREHQGLLAELAAELRGHHPRAMWLLLAVSRRISELLCEDVMTRAGVRLACERDQIGDSAPSLLDDWSVTVAEILRDARDQGDLLPGVDPQDAADFIITAFAGLQRRGYPIRSKGDLHRRATTMWRLLLPGLTTPACTAELMKELG
jgi:AcrR family transcriptional regulator